MMRTLFILGAAGFIGRETVSAALESGWEVIALARSDEGAARLRASGARAKMIARHVHADPAALLETGFAYRYPSYREGVPATLAALGPATQAARAAHA